MSVSIYIETIESSADEPVDLVMLHGWAMHSGLMKELAEKLTGRFRVHLVDLPGHGASPLNSTTFNLQQLTDHIVSAIENKIANKAIWLGWSLGGLAALTIAERYPQVVSQLVLLASTPAFVKQDDWQHAVDKQVFEKFANDLQDDLPATIVRFLSLQVRGTEDSRQTLKKLREIIFAKETPARDVLSEGLAILQQTDLRQLFNNIGLPILLLGGERDTLVPSQALHELEKNTNVEALIISKAGHAPFLSHVDQCAEAITGFYHD
ncbi:MAG: pimeloyl-ACP methyl ester esterase BioH [Gammaproteobacteria bacterium]